MLHLNRDEIIKKIIEDNNVSSEIRKEYLKNKSFKDIRDWLEANKIDRHLTINLEAANVLVIIETTKEPKKILVQIRSTEKNRIGLFGGGIDDFEYPKDAAIRELKEETGIETCKEELNFIETNEHDLEYENGDRVHYKSYVYRLKLTEYPIVKINNESNGFMLLSENNYKEFMYIKDKDAFQLHKYWWNLISSELKK